MAGDRTDRHPLPEPSRCRVVNRAETLEQYERNAKVFLLSILAATLIAAITSVYGLALFESWIFDSTERTLKLAGQRLEHRVDTVRAEVETTAAKFARSSRLNGSFMALDDLLYDQRERPWNSKNFSPRSMRNGSSWENKSTSPWGRHPIYAWLMSI